MNRTFYILVALVLSVNAWDLKVLDSILNDATAPAFGLVWMLTGWIYFGNMKNREGGMNLVRYNRYFYWLALGFALSFITAYLFWYQDLTTSLIVNRRLFFFLFIPVFLRIQPSESEIIKALSFYTVFYMLVWIWQAITPYPVTTSMEIAIDAGRGTFGLTENDFGYLMPGYSLLLIPLYYRIQKFTEDISIRTFIPVIIMTGFLFLLQNRGTLFFAVIVFGFSILRIRSRYRYFFIIVLGLLVTGAYFTTEKYWTSFISETSEQLADPDYNRWKSLYYFLFNYSPHWLCNVLGNGYLSSRNESGQFLIALMNYGFFQADLGIIGFWSMYGIIPLIVIYTIIIRLLVYASAPFYIKALAAHVLLIPICWGFSYYDMLLFVIMSYMTGYYSEIVKAESLKVAITANPTLSSLICQKSSDHT
ncbi:MAG TPA: hypothetical protein VHO46_04860 [Bacteroidales bacterium]|nr:hypothetical protein [Bacteroidales bacterium]